MAEIQNHSFGSFIHIWVSAVQQDYRQGAVHILLFAECMPSSRKRKPSNRCPFPGRLVALSLSALSYRVATFLQIEIHLSDWVQPDFRDVGENSQETCRWSHQDYVPPVAIAKQNLPILSRGRSSDSSHHLVLAASLCLLNFTPKIDFFFMTL